MGPFRVHSSYSVYNTLSWCHFNQHCMHAIYNPAMCFIRVNNAYLMRVTPSPLLVRSIQGVFRWYAVRKGWVRSTQKSCISYADINFLLLKVPIFIKKHKKCGIQSQISLIFRARAKSFKQL